MTVLRKKLGDGTYHGGRRHVLQRGEAEKGSGQLQSAGDALMADVIMTRRSKGDIPICDQGWPFAASGNYLPLVRRSHRWPWRDAMAERCVDHLHEVDDIEHRQPGGSLDVGAIWRHVGAFEHNRPDLGVLGA